MLTFIEAAEAGILNEIKKLTVADDRKAYWIYCLDYHIKEILQYIGQDKNYKQMVSDCYTATFEFYKQKYPDASEEFLEHKAKNSAEKFTKLFLEYEQEQY